MTVATDRPITTVLNDRQKPVTFDEFVEWYPDHSEFRYELRRGMIFQMPKPTGDHSQIAGFNHDELAFEIRQKKLPYFIPKECVIKRFDIGLSTTQGWAESDTSALPSKQH